jgi:hypothetical protein
MENVVQYVDEVPAYDLTGQNVCFPLRMEQGGADLMAYFVMNAQVPAHEVKSFLSDMVMRFKSNDSDEREMEFGEENGCRKFIEKNFRGIIGVEGDPSLEDMKAWLDDNPDIKTRIFREGYDRVMLDAEDEPVRKGLVIGRAIENPVKTKLILYSPERETIESVKVTHVCRKETEEDRIRYKRSSRMADKGRTQIIRFNWDVIEQLYNSLITSLSGAYLNGEPCTEKNKDGWLRLVPISWKVFVVSRIFSKVAVKNG